jgi:hypothetical protein
LANDQFQPPFSLSWSHYVFLIGLKEPQFSEKSIHADSRADVRLFDGSGLRQCPVTLVATGGMSGNPVTFTVVSGPGSLTGSVLAVNGAGTIVIAADQQGNTNCLAAPEVRALKTRCAAKSD